MSLFGFGLLALTQLICRSERCRFDCHSSVNASASRGDGDNRFGHPQHSLLEKVRAGKVILHLSL